MPKLFKVVGVSIILSFVTSSYGDGNNDNDASFASRGPHYTNLIVGGGMSGLYTAWRLSSQRSRNESTAIYEWSPVRLGGRVITKVFPNGQFIELGAMRFLAQHLLLNQVLVELNLTDLITDFPMTDNRLYYIRGVHVYHNDISRKGAPYNTIYSTEKPDTLFSNINENVGPAQLNSINRANWCKFFDEGAFPSNVTSNVYNENDTVGNTGYWNLLVDQLGNEGYQYAAETGGFASIVINGNAAYSIYFNREFEASTAYQRLKPGFRILINTFEEECQKNHVEIKKGKRLTKFHWNANERKFYSTFTSYDKNGKQSLETLQVTSDRLFLCVPKHSLELIEETEVFGDNWPTNTERFVLKHSQGQFYINSVIQKPSYKIALLYDNPWWLNSTYKPQLRGSPDKKTCKIPFEMNYGPTVTSLPLQQILYFGNNAECSDAKNKKPMYALLASFNDMRFTKFWEELEVPPNESLKGPDPSFFLQPLFNGTKVTDVMQRVLREQLNLVHYKPSEGLQVPVAKEGYFMNWGHDPYGAGYNFWKAHHKIADAMYYMTRPSEAINVEVPLHVAGEAYSFDQSWMEGAFGTAESILVDKIGLKPLLTSSAFYPLICRPNFTDKG